MGAAEYNQVFVIPVPLVAHLYQELQFWNVEGPNCRITVSVDQQNRGTWHQNAIKTTATASVMPRERLDATWLEPHDYEHISLYLSVFKPVCNMLRTWERESPNTEIDVFNLRICSYVTVL